MVSEQLESFREAYRNLELLPLRDEKDLARFRVEYGTDAIEELEQLVEDDPNGNGKIVFTGHRGCGKSTLLGELSRRLNDRFFVVFFSISDLIEMSDVNHINILFAIAVMLMEEAETNQVNIKDALRESFFSWFAKHTRIEQEEFKKDISAGINLFKIIKATLSANATVREEIRLEFQKKISELAGNINLIAATIEGATKQEVLVIIDDIDKLDLKLVRELFQEQIKALFQPNFRIIFTVPISALRQVTLRQTIVTETNDQIVFMPVSKLFIQENAHKIDRTPIEKELSRLQDILYKRLPKELVEPATADKMILASGGVLRELIRIANGCCRICLRLVRRQPEETIKINQEILQEVIDKLSIEFDTPIGRKDYDILKATYDKFTPDDPQDQRFLDLLHGLYVLEYRNAKLWYDLHPIVVELLRGKEVI